MKSVSCAALAAVVACASSLASGGETVRVSSFGWMAEDSTEYLQKAFDSGAETVIVDRAKGPWVTRPLFARSNQTVVFEKGVELVAKKGEFRGLADCLFTVRNCTNVTIRGAGAIWRMHRADYDAAPYKKGEWRHSLNILGSANVMVEGLTLLESGGDGVYVGSSGTTKFTSAPSANIVLRDLVCDRHYRQGMSIITVRGLLIERCTMINTWGTAPAAGIDFEPNRVDEYLEGCVMRDCIVRDNQGSGVEFYLGQLDASSPSVDVRIERVRSSGNARGFVYGTGRKPTFPVGRIAVVDCTFGHERGPAASIRRKPAASVALSFERCGFVNCHTRDNVATDLPDVELHGGRQNEPVTDGIVFRDCLVRQGYPRAWISGGCTALAGDPVEAVTGNVRVRTPFGTEDIVLDKAWCATHFERPELRVLPPEVAFDAATASPVDGAPGRPVPLAQLVVREKARYRFYAPAAGAVHFTGRTCRIGKRELKAVPLAVRDAAGGQVGTVPALPEKAAEFAVEVPAAGFYTLEANVSGHAIVLSAADVAVALVASGEPVDLLCPVATVFFRVRENAPFMVALRGEGSERVHGLVRNPDGQEVWEKDNFCQWKAFAAERGPKGLWSLSLRRPTEGVYDDCMVMLRGISPDLFLSDKKTW